MSDAISVTAPISGTDRTLSFEAGKLAQLADGAVLARIGDTVLLATATAARSVREGADFFPLTVDIEERAYAAGKIPGSFFRREGKASDQAILTCRLIDRPLRPSFPKGFRNEVHVVGTIFGADQVNPHDVLAINAASAALMISGIPFEGPIGAVRVAYTTDGRWVPHPTFQEGDESTFELVVAGRALTEADDAEIAIMMVEAGGSERSFQYYEEGAPQVTEEVLADGLEAAKTWIRESILLQRQLVEAYVAARGPIQPIEYSTSSDYGDDVWERVVAEGTDAVSAANLIVAKAERNAALSEATEHIVSSLTGSFPDREGEIKAAVRGLTKKLVRKRIVEEGVRIDGRTTTEIRPLSAEVDLFPTAHGSALFQRGETQVLNVTTLGMPRMNQLLDTITPDDHKRYMHHYNFPPFSTGETGFMRGPKRREIGHGLLAERALLPVVPYEEDFPYTLRLVSDVLASNGSTSMASVCGSTLSMMAAGVPLRAPVAGIAMGLVSEDGEYVTLTDILGAEDAFGDMDFKVAGTRDVVTALQLDTKIDGLPLDVLTKALLQAKDARLTILDVMAGAIPKPRDEVAESAPKIVSFEIPMDKIGEVIGPKGKVINALQQETGADIAVDDDGMVGTVTIGAKDGSAVEEARRRIATILDPPLAEVGGIYEGKVVNITKFGAFVNILPGRDGLLHISKIGQGKRIDRVEDVLELGQPVEVRVDDIDPQGKVSLSLAGDAPAAGSTGDGAADGARSRARRDSDSGDRSDHRRPAGSDAPSAPTGAASFEDVFAEELAEEFGDLGPAVVESSDRGGGGGGRGGRRRR
ncbi:MAG TPA: polyribonucleotide nucleotidyltransferase [Acidimicrobiales bacterium]|jgi:polyribonucleotide nucleotidyltransferase|nr:polyribonucleotide nucleotidyltransferase [Acidimicrobiales bacterium]